MNYDIARRLIMLRAELEGIHAELNMLRSMPCSACGGKGEVTSTETDRDGFTRYSYTPCPNCDNTGLAGGKEATRDVETH